MARALQIKLVLVGLFLLFSLTQFETIFAPYQGTMYDYDTAKVMITSLCFGVLIGTGLYNLALSFYMRSLEHLFYALAQLFTLLFLINLDTLYIRPFDSVFGWHSIRLFDLSQLLMLIFSLLFIRSFVQHYHDSSIDTLVRIILYLALVDMVLALIFSHAIFIHLVPIFIPIALVLSEASRQIEHKDVPFYYLLVGWGIVLLLVALEYVGMVDFIGVVFPYLHVALALDAVALSLAISYKFKLLEEEQRLQQTLLLQQSRLASMGEMISIVAHQWRQPLNSLAFFLMSIKKHCSNEEGKESIKEANQQLQYMSRTIENFRNFYNPAKEKTNFSIKEACESTIMIFSKDVTLEVKKEFIAFGNQNEFEQVLLNILNNAKDAKEDAAIRICIDAPTIMIADNAGGIEASLLKKIFDPYFSTKESRDGIGLYIAKLIIEKEMKGRLEVQSHDGNTEFKISLPKP